MKKVISILIIFMLFYNSVGFLVVYPFLSLYYKNIGIKQADKPYDKDLIELLVFNKEDILNGKINFRWIHSREFKYNGHLYDVVKKVINDKQVLLYCINDTKEKKLEEEFEKRVHKNTAEEKERPVTKNSFNIFLTEAAKFEEIGFATEYICGFNCCLTDLYNSPYFDIPLPPPRFV